MTVDIHACIRCGKRDCVFVDPDTDKPCAPDDGRSAVTRAEVDAGRTVWDTSVTRELAELHIMVEKRYEGGCYQLQCSCGWLSDVGVIGSFNLVQAIAEDVSFHKAGMRMLCEKGEQESRQRAKERLGFPIMLLCDDPAPAVSTARHPLLLDTMIRWSVDGEAETLPEDGILSITRDVARET